MKIMVKIVVFLFIAFLSTPTILCAIDKDIDTSYFYNMCEEEEENQVPFNEIKSLPSVDIFISDLFYVKSYEIPLFVECSIEFDNLAHQIFSPPPEFI